MSQYAPGSLEQPFPLVRPAITITPDPGPTLEVDCREIPGYFGLVEVGDHTLWTIYDPPDWHLSNVADICAPRPARVHGVEGVEIEGRDWEAGKGWLPATGFGYARLAEDVIQWLANVRLVDGVRVIYTFLDEGFDQDWGERPRRLADRGRYVAQADGSYRIERSGPAGAPGSLGAGVFQVLVGDRAFRCLRCLSLHDADEPTDTSLLVETYITPEGRTILFRRYNAPEWGRRPGAAYAQQPRWDQRFPDHARLVVEGVTFTHWYDCLSHLACGILVPPCAG